MNRGFIKINGQEVTNNEGRGFTLVTVSASCGTNRITTYDTHRYGAASNNFSRYIQSLPNNTRIAAITYDEYVDHLRPIARTALNKLGVVLAKAGWRSSLCFVAMKGSPDLTKQSEAKGGMGPASLETSM